MVMLLVVRVLHYDANNRYGVFLWYLSIMRIHTSMSKTNESDTWMILPQHCHSWRTFGAMVTTSTRLQKEPRLTPLLRPSAWWSKPIKFAWPVTATCSFFRTYVSYDCELVMIMQHVRSARGISLSPRCLPRSIPLSSSATRSLIAVEPLDTVNPVLIWQSSVSHLRLDVRKVHTHFPKLCR